MRSILTISHINLPNGILPWKIFYRPLQRESIHFRQGIQLGVFLQTAFATLSSSFALQFVIMNVSKLLLNIIIELRTIN